MPNATTIRDAVLECFRAHGDAELTLRTVEDWVSRQYPGRWKGVFADVSGLVIGATDGTYRSTDQFLHRVRRGVYRLDEAYRVGRQPRVTSYSTRQEPNLKHASEAVASEPRAGRESPARRCIWVEGIPSVWGTKAEEPWRETLKTHIPLACTEDQEAHGVQLRISLEADTRAGQRFDLDNLCEPVFRVLVSERGYFGGRRPNVMWWSAFKRVERPPGCRIEFGTRPETNGQMGRVIFEGVYRGKLPKRGSDTDIAEWLEAKKANTGKANAAPFAVSLSFGSARVNIADVSTGPTKPIIDNLFPLIGGTVSQPDDWRIQSLLVQKHVDGIADNEVFMCIAALDTVDY